MFTDFFYLLRYRGLKVSLNQWLALIEALDKGLANSSLNDFYFLCRSTLVKSETEYDLFDTVFTEFFKDMKDSEELLRMLEAEMEAKQASAQRQISQGNDKLLSEEEIEELEKQSKNAEDANVAGAGIRQGDEGRFRSAVKVAKDRNFRDFRDDTILNTRQFEMSLKKLRQLSTKGQKERTELDIERTIQKTCNNGGFLQLEFQKPRENNIKLLLLFDSDGSMWQHMELCNRLFQAAHKNTKFRDLKTYYFHNCIYQDIFTTPFCKPKQRIDTDVLLRNTDSDYKVVFVGDASMNPAELMNRGGSCRGSAFNEEPGIVWLERFRRKFTHCVWLNPMGKAYWYNNDGSFTVKKIGEIFPMYELTLNGLEQSIKKLLVAK